MVYKILAINPGSTSTKFALYENETEKYIETINHNDEDLAPFQHVTDQLAFRLEHILSRLEELNLDTSDLSAVVGRGGMLPPVHAGGYYVNDTMKEILTGGALLPHASNLGALIVDAIAAP